MSKAVVASYDYRDLTGPVIATKHRYEPKSFAWSVALPDGGTSYRLGDAGISLADLPLYRYPELVASNALNPVFWVEGEKDADNLNALGLVATCCAEGGGANVAKWSPVKLSVLNGRQVVILPDNDKAGEEHARNVAAALKTAGASVSALRLPGLPEKGDVSDWLESGGTREDLLQLVEQAEPLDKPKPAKVVARPGAVLADEVKATIQRFVVLSDEAASALALWVLHTHCFEAAEFTPYIQITSPTRESGKTTLIDVLEALVPDPLRADSATAAAIYRSVDRGRGVDKPTGRPPVLFLDELDAVFGTGGGKSDRAEAIRGVLNSGFRSTGKTLVCDGDTNEPRAFVTFCAKVLAAIGACIPDTVTSRSIPIPLSRATRDELRALQSARAKTLRAISETLAVDIATWATATLPSLKRREEPVLGLKARHDDVWGPLLAIADEIGGEWPKVAREAARVLHADTGDTTDGRDAGIALLADLRDLFDAEGAAFITSARLAELLRGMEGRPWPEYRNGSPISVHGIARLLRPFGIAPAKERVGYETVRAYFAADCREAFRRYLPQSATTATTGHSPSGEACSGSLPRGGSQSVTAVPSVATVATVAITAEGVPLPPFDPAAATLTPDGYPAEWDTAA